MLSASAVCAGQKFVKMQLKLPVMVPTEADLATLEAARALRSGSWACLPRPLFFSRTGRAAQSVPPKLLLRGSTGRVLPKL